MTMTKKWRFKQVRGLVPKQATVHPDLTPAQMATQCNGLFKNKHLPGLGLYFGTDASGGLREGRRE